ncbi:MAG TPA: Arc family DNA binding domain-containing protein [Ferruginibacter sp.]|nr:Arc family DNA binding domain-containing protein [Bacteroidota bacterium]MBS1926005.1 Arc family DNA binding domain-containing protein [Bacteroidota bacterium]MCC6693808.1 Arc family DNA binding domain-containing protein [Chitinophagaceae bacterium]HMT95565.1 Arc family DNA binding domain-containing protein [Ferruginibacter sp.]HMU25179.1 Arc family DNA binding domain-containing protein [Ferruginibacter sp.]
MPVKKNFILRLDPEMYKILEKWAADEFRSVNGQIEFLLNKAMLDTGRNKMKLQKIVKKKV